MTEQTPNDGSTVPTDPWLFPRDKANEMATDKLAQMTKQYLEANRPKHDPIAERYQMKGHRIDRLVSGDPKELARFQEALKAKAEADPISVGMSGDLPEAPSSEVKQIAIGANWLRELGLPEQAIHDYIAGAPVEQSFHDQVAAWKTRSMKDAQFVDAYLKGDGDAVRRMTVANAVLISPIKENAA
jgi:hypothetical protein